MQLWSSQEVYFPHASVLTKRGHKTLRLQPLRESLFLLQNYQLTLASPVQKCNRNEGSTFSCKASVMQIMWIHCLLLWVKSNLLQDFSKVCN